ncbi:hypothetical protein [Streptomyces sp. SID12501]|uniref:Uncharacterized protein n=1 Tax=Streptomyces sp. SID12501 TaxID=2706042 RepID=A0A6B3BWS1_9ACTN|nr:hypothetical protein [Streptomyces sp. SID12501]NEC88775.1 hypothetical protein [Streptomyces sp. SID12501]
MPHSSRQERASRGPAVPLLVVLCGVLLLAAVAVVVWPVVSVTPTIPGPSLGATGEKRGVPGAALQKTFRLAVPAGAREASYLVVPGDGSAESSQDLYLRFRTTAAGLKGFLTSLDKTTGDLTADDAVLDQDDIDSVDLPWKIGSKGHLAGLYADIPEQSDTVGTALLTVDESEVAKPLVYAHVTV